MEEYLNKSIKEIISKFPEIGRILDEYKIGCTACTAGSCLLKDIVEIHNLSEDEEGKLMARIARVISPDRHIKIPKIKRKIITGAKEIKYSPPIKKLIDEHILIKKLVALIPRVVDELNVESEEDRNLVRRCIDFIRLYADKYHHAKEEDILFKYFDGKLDIIKTMLEDHNKARGHVRATLEALDKKSRDAIAEHMIGYHELLTEHIKKEDEILYPWIDRNLSVTQVGELFSRFNEVDEMVDMSVIEECKEIVTGLEERMRVVQELRIYYGSNKNHV